MRSWPDTASNTATAAENKPVYGVPVDVHNNENGETKTHKNENAISILLPAVGHLIVFFLCNL